EPLTQFLIFVGLLAFARWEARGSPAWGALAGTALGLTLLVRIDSVLIVVPLVLYCAVRLTSGAVPARRAAAVLLPFGLIALHAGFHAAVFARKYVVQIATRRYWRYPAPVWVAAAIAAVAIVPLLRRHGPALARALPARRPALRAAALA